MIYLLQASDALDDKVDVLVDAALEKEVPVIYCLSRRRIGRWVGWVSVRVGE